LLHRLVTTAVRLLSLSNLSSFFHFLCYQCTWHCWLGNRKGIQPVRYVFQSLANAVFLYGTYYVFMCTKQRPLKANHNRLITVTNGQHALIFPPA